MTIQYHKSGILSVIEQNIEISIEKGNFINIKGTGYKFIEKGIARGWFLDTFKLKANSDKTILEGVIIDKRDVESKVSFYRGDNPK